MHRRVMDHRSQVCALVEQYQFRTGVELGLASGKLFKKLLMTFPELHMIGVDRSIHIARKHMVREIQRAYSDRSHVLEMLTSEAASKIPDGSQDFVFIDADHSYEGCRQDIRMYLPKIRSGGLIMGHDYNASAYPGVIRAVDETFSNRVRIHDDCVWSVEV